MISKPVKRSDEMDRVFGLSPDTFDRKAESVLTDDCVARPVHPKVLAEVLEKWIISAESRRE